MKVRLSVCLAGLFLSVVLAFSLAAAVSAAPAAPVELTLTQPDGSMFIARQWGDEWVNGYETLDGYTILQQEDGWWVYAETAADGGLAPVPAGEGNLRVGSILPEGLPLHARPVIPDDVRRLTAQSGIQSRNSGNQPTLVLLASFSDRSGTYTAANFASSMFGATGSVKDYYLDASFNQLTLTAATETHGTANDGIVGWLNLGYSHPNTGGSTGTANQLIVKNALIAADPYINYASYDTNGDGYISINELHLVVIVAGYERSYSNSSPSVWGHRWSLNGVTPPTLDGKVLGDSGHNGGYAQFGEIHLDHQATIGIMVHELGHDITWPDLYDTDGSSDGVGVWSIMGSGSWNATSGNYYGSSPALPDAWLKWYQGWITPTTVNGTLTGAAIPQAETNAKAFLLRPNPGGVDWEFYQHSGTGEFFLVENRQLTGYDAGLPGCGLLIWHMDESVTYSNSANANETHPLMKLMQADGLDELLKGDSQDSERGDNGDPFPGSATNRTFTYSSNPNSRLYNGSDSLVQVTNVSNCSATMTANLTYSGAVALQAVYLPAVLNGWAPIQVLWSQGVSSANTEAYANQDFETSFDSYDIYLSDDFLISGDGWDIWQIHVPGGLWNGGTTLANATSLNFQIFIDNNGKPAGYPGGASALVWSLSIAPSDSRILLSNGVGGLPSNVTLKLSSPVRLAAERYWFVFYPTMEYSLYGQYGRQVSDTVNGYDAMVINPGGGFGFPTDWMSIQDDSTWLMAQQDLAFEIRGTR